MDDVYQADSNRILVRTTTGVVQAWKAEAEEWPSIAVSFDLDSRSGGNGHASFSQYLLPADARSLAAALLKAADHADALAMPAPLPAEARVATPNSH